MARRHEGTKARRIVGAALALLVSGCGAPRGAVFEPLAEPLVWPPAPEPPRVAYVGALSTSADLKPGKSVFQGLGEALFGEEPARSMLTPFAVCTDDADRVFVADTNAQCVHVFDLQKRTYAQWQPDEVTDAFAQPVGVVFHPTQKRLMVSDSVAGTIFVFDDRGSLLGRLGDDELERPAGLAVDPTSGGLVVADAAAHQVLVLDVDGTLIDRIGRRGTQLGEFNYPTNVAVTSDGRIYVADTLNFRVQVLDADRRPIQQIGSHGDLPGYFSQPKGVALDTDGNLYVVDAHFETVQAFDASGRLLLNFGQEGQGPGEFWLPAGIHIDSTDRIWVADSYNRRVQVFERLPEGAR